MGDHSTYQVSPKVHASDIDAASQTTAQREAQASAMRQPGRVIVQGDTVRIEQAQRADTAVNGHPIFPRRGH